jgi:hypothetical protein
MSFIQHISLAPSAHLESIRVRQGELQVTGFCEVQYEPHGVGLGRTKSVLVQHPALSERRIWVPSTLHSENIIPRLTNTHSTCEQDEQERLSPPADLVLSLTTCLTRQHQSYSMQVLKFQYVDASRSLPFRSLPTHHPWPDADLITFEQYYTVTEE